MKKGFIGSFLIVLVWTSLFFSVLALSKLEKEENRIPLWLEVRRLKNEIRELRIEAIDLLNVSQSISRNDSKIVWHVRAPATNIDNRLKEWNTQFDDLKIARKIEGWIDWYPMLILEPFGVQYRINKSMSIIVENHSSWLTFRVDTQVQSNAIETVTEPTEGLGVEVQWRLINKNSVIYDKQITLNPEKFQIWKARFNASGGIQEVTLSFGKIKGVDGSVTLSARDMNTSHSIIWTGNYSPTAYVTIGGNNSIRPIGSELELKAPLVIAKINR